MYGNRELTYAGGMPKVASNGVELEYVDRGNGDPLMLVMGLWVWIKMGKLTRARADLPSDGNDLSGNEVPPLLSGEDIADVERLLGDTEPRARP